MKNYYEILSEGKSCNLLKTSQLDPDKTEFAVLSRALSELDGCILHEEKIFYVNQYHKTCRLVRSDGFFYVLLYSHMVKLKNDTPTIASASHLAYIREITEHMLSKVASQEEIKNAYKTLARIYHPDRNQDPTATAKFQEISNAYEHLSDENKRRIYDASITQNIFSFQESLKQSFEDALIPFDLRYEKKYPEDYKCYTDPEADFTT